MLPQEIITTRHTLPDRLAGSLAENDIYLQGDIHRAARPRSTLMHEFGYRVGGSVCQSHLCDREERIADDLSAQRSTRSKNSSMSFCGRIPGRPTNCGLTPTCSVASSRPASTLSALTLTGKCWDGRRGE